MHLIIVELLHYDNGHKETLHQMTGSNKNSQTGFKEFLFLFIVYQQIFQISTIQTKTICGYYFFPIEMWNHIVLFLFFKQNYQLFVCLYGFIDIKQNKFY